MRNILTAFLVAFSLLFSSIAIAEVYFTRNVNGTYTRPNPQPILPAANQVVTLTSGSPPPVVKYYVRRQFTTAGKKIFKFVEAPRQPIILAANQSLTYLTGALETQQGYVNPTNPVVPPPPTVNPEDQTPTLYLNVKGPPRTFNNFCRGETEQCDTIPPGVKATVWYGAGSELTSTWHKRTYVQGSIPCTTAAFGGTNPAPGTYKRCFWVDHVNLDRTRLDPKGQNLQPIPNLALNPTFNTGLNFFSSKPAGLVTPENAQSDIGAFRVSCAASHIGNFDPIIFPGLDNSSHQHVFFANQGVNPNTTSENIRLSGAGTCDGGTANRSGYWVPSLIDITTGRAQKPSDIVLYYKTSANPAYNVHVTVPPPGLKMIAGNARPLALVDSTAQFTCQDQTSVNTPPNYGITWAGNSLKQGCGDPTGNRRYMLRQIIVFPQCWDGVNLDSPDHKSHMAFTCEDCDNGNGGITKTFNGCPVTHPVLIPHIAFNVDYHLDKNTKDYRLSSDNYPLTEDGGYSSHGDWMNGWTAGILERIVNNCLKPSLDCGGPNLGDGEFLSGFYN